MRRVTADVSGRCERRMRPPFPPRACRPSVAGTAGRGTEGEGPGVRGRSPPRPGGEASGGPERDAPLQYAAAALAGADPEGSAEAPGAFGEVAEAAAASSGRDSRAV